MRLPALIFGSIIALAAQAQKVVLRGATVLEMTGASPRAADLVLEGERIAEVVPPGTGQGERVVDLRGKFVLPGLADLHAHVLVQPTDEADSARRSTGSCRCWRCGSCSRTV